MGEHQCPHCGHITTGFEQQDFEARDAELRRLRAALLKFVDHFGPLEDNHMLHNDARACFKLARAALGGEEHNRAIIKSLQS